LPAVIDFADNAYNCPNWHMIPILVKTNTPANTACRSPGTFPSIAIMEYMIEHVARYMNLDVLQVRQANLYKKGQVTPHGQPLPYFNVDTIINNLIDTCQYNQRLNDIMVYNQENRWKKRGISLVPLKWGANWGGAYYNTYVTIYNGDGSVSICHGGVETGQGISTKAAQVCAYELGIPLELITIRPGDNLVNANSMTTGGSTTSELICQSIIECCKIINANLEPVKKTMPTPYKWSDLINKAISMGIDLSARYWIYPNQETPLAYNVYGAAVSESIVDVLTGEVQILRTDILYDCGNT
jgi:xanthine dehydrogenase/oxidase